MKHARTEMARPLMILAEEVAIALFLGLLGVETEVVRVVVRLEGLLRLLFEANKVCGFCAALSIIENRT
jgi:hypothetical protein